MILQVVIETNRNSSLEKYLQELSKKIRFIKVTNNNFIKIIFNIISNDLETYQEIDMFTSKFDENILSLKKKKFV